MKDVRGHACVCTGGRVNAKYEWIASWFGKWFRTHDLRISQTHFTTQPTTVSSVLTIWPWPVRKSELLQTEWYYTLATTASRSEQGGLTLGYLNMALAFPFNFYGGDMKAYLHALAWSYMPIINDWIHDLERRFGSMNSEFQKLFSQ